LKIAMAIVSAAAGIVAGYFVGFSTGHRYGMFRVEALFDQEAPATETVLRIDDLKTAREQAVE
jgi:hypothetical protein